MDPAAPAPPPSASSTKSPAPVTTSPPPAVTATPPPPPPPPQAKPADPKDHWSPEVGAAYVVNFAQAPNAAELAAGLSRPVGPFVLRIEARGGLAETSIPSEQGSTEYNGNTLNLVADQQQFKNYYGLAGAGLELPLGKTSGGYTVSILADGYVGVGEYRVSGRLTQTGKDPSGAPVNQQDYLSSNVTTLVVAPDGGISVEKGLLKLSTKFRMTFEPWTNTPGVSVTPAPGAVVELKVKL